MVHLYRPLVIEPGVYDVHGEHVAFEEKLVVLFEGVEHFGEAAGGGLNRQGLLGFQVVEVSVYGSGGRILFCIPSSPAMSRAAKARYPLQEGSGGRYSMRLAFSLRE